MNPNNGCTCMQVWASVVPPPPCPVHSCTCHCPLHPYPPLPHYTATWWVTDYGI